MAHIVTPDGEIHFVPDKTDFSTNLEKRYKILMLLVSYLESEELMAKMIELALKIDEEHPKAEEAVCFYEDKIIEILQD